ncbi:hypothetical protein ILYODFUR_024607 [Ilyodon furcidens]|uniref:Uncharacterized protein n=1 Tax=Ilyodon furcidens TaxID=33524 RepID=A0ABV0T0Z2_9TELE
MPECFAFSDQAGSFLLPPLPGPRHKRTMSNAIICTLNSLLKSPSLLEQHLRKHLNKFSFDNLDSESLYPWRPDHTHLLKIRPFTFPDYLWHNKNIILLILFLWSVLLYVGQIYYENNDRTLWPTRPSRSTP